MLSAVPVGKGPTGLARATGQDDARQLITNCCNSNSDSNSSHSFSTCSTQDKATYVTAVVLLLIRPVYTVYMCVAWNEGIVVRWSYQPRIEMGWEASIGPLAVWTEYLMSLYYVDKP